MQYDQIDRGIFRLNQALLSAACHWLCNIIPYWLKNMSCHDANFVVLGGTGDFHKDNHHFIATSDDKVGIRKTPSFLWKMTLYFQGNTVL